MKGLRVLILTMLFMASSFASEKSEHVLGLNFKPDRKFFASVLENLWPRIPYSYSVGELQIEQTEKFSLKLLGGSVSMGPEHQPLFDLSPHGSNRLNVEWLLGNVKTDLKFRVDFTINIFGMRIRKHEELIVKTRGIKNSKSLFSLNLKDGKFIFETLGNHGFEVDQIEIVSTDDDILTWVLERANKRILKYVNEEIKEFLNSDQIMNEISTFANDILRDAQGRSYQINDVASVIKVDFKKLQIEKDLLNLEVETNFVGGNTFSNHDCASQMVSHKVRNQSELKSNSTGTLHSTFPFIEKIVNNMATKKVDSNNDGIPDEPLFCFGYKDPNDLGSIQEIEFEALGKKRKAKLRYWAHPLKMPKYTYRPESQELALELDMKVFLKSLKSYPRFVFKKDFAETKFYATFGLEIVEGEGLRLVPKTVDLGEFKGKLYLKLKWYLPKFKVSFEKVETVLEEELLEILQDFASETNIIDQSISAGNLEVQLKKYFMKENQHLIDFDVIF